MKWSPEADNSLKKVPFFVRKRVRARVEKEAREAGRRVVSLADVKATQARYLKSMSSEIKGYQLDTCFGPNGCPNRAAISDTLLQKIEVPVLVIAGSEDSVVQGLSGAMAGQALKPGQQFAVVEGADHFFRDLYAYDVVELVTAFMDEWVAE